LTQVGEVLGSRETQEVAMAELFPDHYAELDQLVPEGTIRWEDLGAVGEGAVDPVTVGRLRAANTNELLLVQAKEDVRLAANAVDSSVASVNTQLDKGTTELAEAQGELSGAIANAGLTLGQLQQHLQAVGDDASGTLRRLVDWLVDHVTRVLAKVAGSLHVENWSVTVQGGFPAGVNVSIAVTFGS
jgi:hypothetical protein